MPPLRSTHGSISEKLDYWRKVLIGDINSEFLLKGLEHGFMIVDKLSPVVPSFRDNYKSAEVTNRAKVEAQILSEIALGNYIVTTDRPAVVSSLGAVPKAGSSEIRIIHDLSQPNGGINKWASNCSVKYSSVDTATRLLPVNGWMAKCDLRHAYRSVALSPLCYELTGLRWKFSGCSEFTYIRDARLPFGSSMSCNIFQQLTDAVCRVLARMGFCVVSYLDDFIIMEETKTKCWLAYDALEKYPY